MDVSYSTVKTHVSHLLTKLDARDRARDPDSDRGTTAGGKLRGVRWPGRLGLRA